VKQGPLAVITNALMPAVLVEVGFLTNPAEERLVTQGTFQQNTANAVAAAVREFFRRYPSGASLAPDKEMNP
jgi:N-acetylmuramoyl-L-alanine amidase